MATPKENPLLQAALAYAAIDWCIVPLHTPENGVCSCGASDCDRAGKHPRIKNWETRASRDPNMIRSWWSRWPTANIGIVTGKISGITVVDVDDPSIQIESLQLSSDHDYWIVETGRGGYHVYCRYGGERSATGIMPGIDLRGDGGLVVAPPSAHANGGKYKAKSYAVLTNNNLGPVPVSLRPLPPVPPDSATPSPALPAPAAPGTIVGYLQSALDGELSRIYAASEGERNDALNRAAFALGTLVGGGALDEGLVTESLIEAGIAVGLGAQETRATVRSGLKAGMKRPRSVDPPARQNTAQSVQLHRPAPPVERFSPVDYLRERPTLAEEQLILDTMQEGEYGWARLFAELYRGRLCYDHAEKTWYLWGGHSWYQDKQNIVLLLVAGQLARQYLMAAGELSPEFRSQSVIDKLIKTALALRGVRNCRNVIEFAKAMLPAGDWDNDPMLLAVENGVIDLRTGKLGEGNPDQFIRTVSPVAWAGLDAPAPRFEQFVNEIFENAEISQFLARLLGYSITGLTTEHILPILYGPQGRNGKDTLLETIGRVLGPLATPASQSVLMATRGEQRARPELMTLRGKRLAWVSETGRDGELAEAQVKSLTGGGTIRARQLHQEEVSWTPTHTLLMITNHRPKVSAEDQALWQRLILLPFEIRFVEHPTAPNERPRDTNLKEKLATEGPGILAWLVRGCLQWQRDGLQVPDVVRAATADYRNDEDDIGAFLASCCVQQEGATARAGELYQAYANWCESNGNRAWGGKRFGQAMATRFERRRSGYQGNIYYGIGLLAEHNDAPADGAPAVVVPNHQPAPMFDEKPQQPAAPPLGREGKTAVGETVAAVGAPQIVPPIPQRLNVNERRELIASIRRLLREVGQGRELSIDLEAMQGHELRSLINQLYDRRKQ